MPLPKPKGELGKIPPGLLYGGAAVAGVVLFLWWRNRQAGGPAAAGTTNTASAGLAAVGLPSVSDVVTASGTRIAGTPAPATPPTGSGAGGKKGGGGTGPPPPRQHGGVTLRRIRLMARQGAFSGVSISHAPALGGVSQGGGGPVSLAPYPGTSGPNTVIPTLGTGGAWSIFNQGGGTGAARAWAVSLLRKIGAPVSPGNVKFVYDWQVAEGAGGANNPLNQGPVPGQPGLTNTGQQFGGGAAGFVSRRAGLQGSAAYLNMPSFRGILSALRANQPTQARAALIASPWAASHYGGGANFPNTAPPPPPKGRKPVLPSTGQPYVPPGGWVSFPKVTPAPARRPATKTFRWGTPARKPARRPAPLATRGVSSRYVTAIPHYRAPAPRRTSRWTRGRGGQRAI